ncbi:MAG: hypothetical protein R3B09_35110 [Nannocystaceae bacterium]
MTEDALLALAPPVILGMWALLLAAIARVGVDAAPAMHRGIGALGALLALAAAGSILGDPAFDAGHLILAGALVVDHLAALGDAAIALALALALALDRSGRGQGARAALLSIAAAGLSLTIHAVDLLPLVGGLEIAGLALVALVAQGLGGGARGRRWLVQHGVVSAILLFGVALIVAATGVTRVGELSGRVAMVFTRWGASAAQASVDLLESGVPIPDALEAEARTRAVTAMAPVALYVPGMLLTLFALLHRLGVAFGGRLRAEVYDRAPAAAIALLELGVRTAATIALLRLFVSGLHVPRQVFAPYGWSTPAAAIAGVTLGAAAIAALRARAPRRWLAAQGLLCAGLVAVTLCAAANFYAHAGLRSSGVVIVDHHEWGMQSGEAAVAAAIALCLAQGLAAIGLLAVLRSLGAPPGAGALALQGLLRRRRGLGLAAFVCIAALCGAPPTAVCVARVDLLAAVLVDNNLLLRIVVIVAALASTLATLAGLRLLAQLLERPRAGGESAEVDRIPAAVAIAIAALTLIAGVWVGPTMQTCALAAAGTGTALGHSARAERVQALRARLRPGDALEAAAPTPDGENAVDQAAP